jgi:SAM-dependent methyltransferase
MTLEVETIVTPPPEVLERGRRERDFFNRYNDSAEIKDADLMAAPTLSAIPEEVTEHFPSLQDKYVCDFGCGYGVTSAWFALHGARVFSFDVAETNVAIAKRAARVNRVEGRMTVEVMQAESAPLPSNTFDLVFGCGVLHHLDIEISARQILRILKPGGVAIFREPLGENHILEWIRRSPLRGSRHRHTEDERSLCYADVEVLRRVFPQVEFRETELFSLLGALLREFNSTPKISPRREKLIKKIQQVDRRLLARFSALRPLASYSTICLFKPNQTLTSDDYVEKSA